VFGRVRLADGATPSIRQPFLDTAIDAFVTPVDAGGRPLAEPVRANGSGEYLLAGVSPQTAALSVQVEDAAFQTPARAVGEPVRVDIELPNSAPAIEQLLAFDGDQAVLHAAPGTRLTVSIQASDPDQDWLSFRWGVSGSDGAFVSEDAPEVTWTLPAVEGRHTLYVLVRDGRGGTEFGRLDVTTGPPEAWFAGRVVDAETGAAIPGVRVSVNADTAETDEAGAFYVRTPRAGSRYVLTLSQDGYQLYSRTVNGPLTTEEIRLVPGFRAVIDPNADSQVIEARRSGKPGTELFFEAGSLVDAQGNPAERPLNVFVSPIDPEDPEGRMPGGTGAIDRDGQEVGLISYGAVDVRIRDDEGTAYNVAPGRTVRVAFPWTPRCWSARASCRTRRPSGTTTRSAACGSKRKAAPTARTSTTASTPGTSPSSTSTSPPAPPRACA
jgi:Carboxypeptidase regulatory-like domain